VSGLVPVNCDQGDVASEVVFTPYGDLVATDVQAAIEELEDEKEPRRASCDGLVDLGPVVECVGDLGNFAPGTVIVDASALPVYELTAGAATTIDFVWGTYLPAVIRMQTVVLIVQASGANRTITWPAEVDWPGGVVPPMPLTINTKSIFVFTTTTDGTTVWGNVVGLEYA
jgi:hypothetical protein